MAWRSAKAGSILNGWLSTLAEAVDVEPPAHGEWAEGTRESTSILAAKAQALGCGLDAQATMGVVIPLAAKERIDGRFK